MQQHCDNISGNIYGNMKTKDQLSTHFPIAFGPSSLLVTASNRHVLADSSFSRERSNMHQLHDGSNVQEYKDEIYTVLKNVADREMSLETMAYAIDKRLPKVFPKLIKRVDLGPIHNVFAKDENKVTHAILQGIANKEIPLESYAVSFKIDELKSASEFKEGGFFNKQTFQRWDAVYRQRYVFAPHRIIQLLYNKTPEIMNKLALAPIQISELKINNK